MASSLRSMELLGLLRFSPPLRENKVLEVCSFLLPLLYLVTFLYCCVWHGPLVGFFSVLIMIVISGGPLAFMVVPTPTYLNPFPSGVVFGVILLLWVTYIFKLFGYFPAIHWLELVLSLCGSPVVVFLFFKTMLMDPGYITNVVEDVRLEVENGMREGDFCSVCLVHRPLRAKHCFYCRRCVARFDHHCPWMFTCIANNNAHYFVVFLAAALVHHIHFIATDFIFLRNIFMAPGTTLGAFLVGLGDLYQAEPLLFLCMCVSLPIALGEVMILQGQLLSVGAALTPRETFAPHRYSYLVQDGAIHNRISRGVVWNFLEFFHVVTPRLNWFRIYKEEDLHLSGSLDAVTKIV